MAFSFRAGTNWCHDFPKLARESGFHFNMHRRRVRVDWNRISSIDIDRVITERDFATIDDNVNNVVDYCLESEYDVKILDSNFVKLFRLAQLAVEYLLYCKQYLDHSVVILKEELSRKLEDNAGLRKEQSVNEKLMKELREKLRDRSRIIETKLSDSHGEIHKCPQCSKTFISALFMSAHVNRRHQSVISRTSSNSPVHEHYRAETEKLHSEIKSLKERLNLTERVIRNESDKFLSSDSVRSNDNRERRNPDKSEARNNLLHRDEIIEEQYRRYREEIGNLKATLFDEIRNLKITDRYPPERSDNDDCNNVSIKELIRDQENEITRLRQQACAKPAPSIAETKPDNNEEFWQSKIDNLETRHRADIEKLYAQLRVTQESADRMRLDYMTRMSDLERREASFESTVIEARYVNNDIASYSAMTHGATPGGSKNLEYRPENQPVLLESTKNRNLSREKDRSRDTRISNTSDDNLRDYLSDESIDDSQRRRNQISKEKIVAEEIAKKPSSTPKSSKITIREIKEDEITLTRTDDVGDKRTSGSKVEPTDIRENLINGEVKPRLSSYLPDPRQKISNPDKRERHRGNIRGKSSEPARQKTAETISTKRNVVADRTRKKIQFPVVQDEREKLTTVERDNDNRIDESRRNFKNNDNSESFSDDQESESWLESESPDNSSLTEDEDERIRDNGSRNQNDRGYIEEKIWYRERYNPREVFDSKLEDLGIDPEWRGIPDATFAQALKIVGHHRNISSKKYHKFEDIRRKLAHQLTQRLTIKEINGRIDDPNEQSQLERLVTNVKSKVSKALNILEKNDGSHNVRPVSVTKKLTRREKEKLRKLSPDRSPGKRGSTLGKKGKKIPEPRDSSTSLDLYENEPRINLESSRNIPKKETVNYSTSDVKHMSHSYESIKDFIKDTKGRQARSIFNVTGHLVASTVHKNEDTPIGDSSLIANESANTSATRVSNQPESLSALSINSPRNNSKSVLKSTTGGSVVSLAKKKVFFDLETAEKITVRESQQSMYPTHEEEEKEEEKEEANNRDGKDTSMSDFEISSIHDERDQTVECKNDSQQSEKFVLLKTSQSEKIAQISKQIEQQLSIARRKPAGAVEAMFLDKFTLASENKESAINVHPSFTGPTRLIPENPTATKFEQSIGPTWQNRISRFSNKRNLETEIKDTNLEMDIDELLHME